MLKQTYNEYLLLNRKWGCSSNGRALALHARGTGFDPLHLQIPLNIIFLVKFESTFDSFQHIFLVLFSHCYPLPSLDQVLIVSLLSLLPCFQVLIEGIRCSWQSKADPFHDLSVWWLMRLSKDYIRENEWLGFSSFN